MRDAALRHTSHEQQQQQQWRVHAYAPLDDGEAVASTLMQSDDDALRWSAESTVDTHPRRHQQRHDEPQHVWPREIKSKGCTMVVALFRDGFVCRHFTDASESVEGFAQPYDSDARYASILNSRVVDTCVLS